MSRKLVLEATLRGYEGPLQVSMKELQDNMERIHGFCILNNIEISQACATPGLHHARRLIEAEATTEDGYRWFSAHEFSVGNGPDCDFVSLGLGLEERGRKPGGSVDGGLQERRCAGGAYRVVAQ